MDSIQHFCELTTLKLYLINHQLYLFATITRRWLTLKERHVSFPPYHFNSPMPPDAGEPHSLNISEQVWNWTVYTNEQWKDVWLCTSPVLSDGVCVVWVTSSPRCVPSSLALVKKSLVSLGWISCRILCRPADVSEQTHIKVTFSIFSSCSSSVCFPKYISAVLILSFSWHSMEYNLISIDFRILPSIFTIFHFVTKSLS